MQVLIGFLDGLGNSEMLMLGIIALLLFGDKLPEVARTWGKKVVDFKKNIQSIQDEIRSAAFSATSSLNEAVSSATDSLQSATDTANSSLESGSNGSSHKPRSYGDDYEETTAPKFEPPAADPPRKRRQVRATPQPDRSPGSLGWRSE